jgi:predicted O-linked N-acetylglucosamine transferase (SPINDLY family)
MLTLLELPELIAHERAEYLAIAARLASDSAWRNDLRARIGARQERLFDVSDAIVSLQVFLETGALAA